MTPKEKLKKLIGLPEEKFFSDEELEIEYETEIAHLNSYRSWLEKLHNEWQKTKDCTPSVPSTNTMGKLPRSTSVDFLNVSSKATKALKKLGIKVMSDFEKFTEEQLVPVIGVRPVKVISAALDKYGVSFSTEKITNMLDITQNSASDCTEECEKENLECDTNGEEENAEDESIEEKEKEDNEKIEESEESLDTNTSDIEEVSVIEEVFADEDEDNLEEENDDADDVEPDFSNTFSRLFDDSFCFDVAAQTKEDIKTEENTDLQPTLNYDEVPF